jgi:anti-sigma factor RsiW
MLCWSAKRMLSAHIDGELSPDRRATLARHLAGCPACAARERALRAAWADVPELPSPAVGDDLWAGVQGKLVRTPVPVDLSPWRPRWLAPVTLAACAVAGLLAGTVFALQFPRSTRQAPATVRAPAGEDLFSEAIGEPYLEPWTSAPAERSAQPSGARPVGRGEDAR